MEESDEDSGGGVGGKDKLAGCMEEDSEDSLVDVDISLEDIWLLFFIAGLISGKSSLVSESLFPFSSTGVS